MELIDLVNSVTISILISNDLTQIVNFLTRIPGCDSYSLALLDFFLSSDASVCFTMAFHPLGNSDHVVVSVSIAFLINSKQHAPFHRVAYDCSRADWDGLCNHLRDVPCKDIFRFRLELMYMSLIVSIRSNLTHLHGFIEITFFICTNRINLLNLQ